MRIGTVARWSLDRHRAQFYTWDWNRHRKTREQITEETIQDWTNNWRTVDLSLKHYYFVFWVEEQRLILGIEGAKRHESEWANSEWTIFPIRELKSLICCEHMLIHIQSARKQARRDELSCIGLSCVGFWKKWVSEQRMNTNTYWGLDTKRSAFPVSWNLWFAANSFGLRWTILSEDTTQPLVGPF